MNIVIIGASNSIIGEKGYVLALRRDHDVKNLSGGDIPVTFTISKLLQHCATIAEADWVVLDHSISDRIVYYPRLQQAYLRQIDEVYQLVADTNPNVVSLVFPTLRDGGGDRDYIDALTTVCRARGAVLVDFQGIVTDPRAFEDPFHVHCEVSYLIGEFLRDLIPRLRRSNRHVRAQPTPYRRIEAATLSTDAPIHRFRSSLTSADYVQIDRPMEIAFEESQCLVFIEYVVLRGDPRYLALTVNGASNVFGGLDISGEVILGTPSRRLTLAPVTSNEPLTLTHSDETPLHGPFAPMNLVSLIVRHDAAPVPAPGPNQVDSPPISFAPFCAAFEKLQAGPWFDRVQPLSEASSTLVAELNGKGLARHKEYFGPTFDKGARIRSERIGRYLEMRAD